MNCGDYQIRNVPIPSVNMRSSVRREIAWTMMQLYLDDIILFSTTEIVQPPHWHGLTLFLCQIGQTHNVIEQRSVPINCFNREWISNRETEQNAR